MPLRRNLLVLLASPWVLWFSACFAMAQQPRIVGWRGDGSGKYLSAESPATWSRVSTIVQGLRFLAREPKSGEPGTLMPDGVIRQWLILGPVPIAEDALVEEDTLPGESRACAR